MAVIRIAVRSVDSDIVGYEAWWLMWIVRPMLEWDEDSMANWVMGYDTEDDGETGGWVAETLLLKGGVFDGRIEWANG